MVRQLVRHRDSVIASGTEERIRKKKRDGSEGNVVLTEALLH